eukprot:2180088-Rhodomonas_salina.2
MSTRLHPRPPSSATSLGASLTKSDLGRRSGGLLEARGCCVLVRPRSSPALTERGNERRSKEEEEVGFRVERGSRGRVERVKRGRGGRVEGRERELRWGRGSREGGEVGLRVERGRGGRVQGQERVGERVKRATGGRVEGREKDGR